MVIIYGFLSLIDYIIYSLAGALFRLIVDLANIEFFRDGIIDDISGRIYIIVGVLMLFKLVISAVQYMINPDTFDDKDKGISGILTRVVISLGLIVIVPAIFNFAISMQKTVIESIPNIVFGTEERTNFSDDKTGKNISFQVLSAFVEVREGHESKVNETEKISDLETFQKNIMAGCPKVSLFGIFGSYDDCHYNYIVIISTVAGVFLCYVLFVMTLDVAIRTIKLGVIQILAPIPISSYVFSKDKLNKFFKTALTVYLDLFIRMAIIYFVVFAIQKVIDTGVIKDLTKDADIFRIILANVIIIIGLLMFAKNAPKFITDLLGLEKVTSDDMKDMFTRAGGMFGATIGAGKSFVSSRANARNEALKDAGLTPEKLAGMNRKDKNDAIKKAVKDYNKKQGTGHGVYGRAFRAGGSAFGKGAYQSYIKGKGFKETFDSSDRAGQRSYDLDKALSDNNVSRSDYRRELINRRLGINSDLDVMNAEIEAAKNSSDKSKAALDYGHNNRGAKFATLRFDNDFVNANGGAAKRFVVGADAKGREISVSLADMAVGGKFSINTVENQLKATIEDKDGKLKNMGLAGQEIISKAQKALDELQGLGDKFTVNTSTRDAAYKAKVGYVDNPAFNRVVQEAIEANIIHSTDTQYGRKVWAEADKKGILYVEMDASGNPVKDNNGNIVKKIRPEKMGEWLALNKKMGQEAQTENIAAKGTQAANATIKSIADKYDKK